MLKHNQTNMWSGEFREYADFVPREATDVGNLCFRSENINNPTEKEPDCFSRCRTISQKKGSNVWLITYRAEKSQIGGTRKDI